MELPLNLTTNKKIKKEKQQIILWLAEHFHEAFFLRAKEIKPLKIGIFEDLIDFYDRLDAPPFSKKQIRDALHYYSASPAYLLSQKINAARIDLYGNEVDIVTDGQAKYAFERYQEKYENRANKNINSATDTDEA